MGLLSCLFAWVTAWQRDETRLMRLADLPTPCLVLDRVVLLRNLRRMQAVATAHGVALRPHMKTAKSIDVARLVFEVAREADAFRSGGIAVSTLPRPSILPVMT